MELPNYKYTVYLQIGRAVPQQPKEQMILDYIVALIALAIFAYAGWLIGKRAGLSKWEGIDKNKDDIPDFLQKGGRPKGSKNKKK